jgi:hypothetical protein
VFVNGKLSDRATSDLVVIFLAGVVGFVLVVSSAAMVFAFAFRPEIDVSTVAARVGTVISSMVTGIIGYIAGKGAVNGRLNGNGK